MPATRTSPAHLKPKNGYADLHIVGRHADGQSFRAKVFDSTDVFTFSTDVNAFLMLNAFSGDPGAINTFILSLVDVEVDDDDDDKAIEQKRADTKRKFTDALATQKGLTVQRLVQFVGDLTDAAGNATTA